MNNIKIIYEDKYIIVIDKPSGMPTHMLRLDETGTVVNFLIEHCPQIKGVGTSELMSGLAHRLDTDTSGLVLAVKDNEGFVNLRKQFHEHIVLKEYLLLVHGEYKGPGIISNFIGPDPKSKKKVKVYSEFVKVRSFGSTLVRPDVTSGRTSTAEVVSPGMPGALAAVKGAREAITEVVDSKNFLNYTFLSVRIKTGVRHQIRAHFANLGYPLVGDFLYQNLKNKAKDQLGLTHHFLHAHKIGFYHPNTGNWVEFENKFPEELDEVIRKLSAR